MNPQAWTGHLKGFERRQKLADPLEPLHMLDRRSEHLLIKSASGSETAHVMGARAEVGRPGMSRMTSVTSNS